MTEYEAVLQTPELGPGQTREVNAHGATILLLNLGQRYYALEARCPESGATLRLSAPGTADRLVCTDGHAEYAIPSGHRLDGEGRPLRRYAIRIEGNAIKIGPPL